MKILSRLCIPGPMSVTLPAGALQGMRFESTIGPPLSVFKDGTNDMEPGTVFAGTATFDPYPTTITRTDTSPAATWIVLSETVDGDVQGIVQAMARGMGSVTVQYASSSQKLYFDLRGGPTTERPEGPVPSMYLDTTLKKPVFWWPEDNTWRDAMGNIV